MAEKINDKEKFDAGLFYFFAGIDEEIFEKLPKQDKRPYVVIGGLGFCTILLFGVLLYFISGNYTNSVFTKIGISIISMILINKLHRMIVGRLIHRFNSTKIIFTSYMTIISLLFIMCFVSGAAPVSDFNNSTVESTEVDSTTTSAPASTEVYPTSTDSYPTTTEAISTDKKE